MNRVVATHNSPRAWFITSSLTPLAVRLIRQLLTHGDYVVACLPPHEIEHDDRSAEFRELVNECKSNRKDREGWKDRIRSIRCDGRVMGQCSAAVAEAKHVFGRIDILLCCTSEGMQAPFLRAARSPIYTHSRGVNMNSYTMIMSKQPLLEPSRSYLRRRQHRTWCATSSRLSSSPR